MNTLLKKINDLKNSPISKTINQRIKEFEEISDDKLFEELCFCIMTANFRAEKSIQIQKEIGHLFRTADETTLAQELKSRGHRFWPQRASRIVEARKHIPHLANLRKQSSKESRIWLKENVNGLGMKESSHFLRNVGIKDIAIIDFHIIDLLNEHKIINFNSKPNSTNKDSIKLLNHPNKKSQLITKKMDNSPRLKDHGSKAKLFNKKALNPSTYLEIEKTLSKIGSSAKLCLAELDLYLWYLETNSVLK